MAHIVNNVLSAAKAPFVPGMANGEAIPRAVVAGYQGSDSVGDQKYVVFTDTIRPADLLSILCVIHAAWRKGWSTVQRRDCLRPEK